MSNQDSPDTDSKSVEGIAEEIATRLFTVVDVGMGTRLEVRLKAGEYKGRNNEKPLGGWCFEAAVDQIKEILEEGGKSESQPEAERIKNPLASEKTLRDEFAGQMMHALYSGVINPAINAGIFTDEYAETLSTTIAHDAYVIANAMLEERGKHE